jgi:hypothetical protein
LTLWFDFDILFRFDVKGSSYHYNNPHKPHEIGVSSVIDSRFKKIKKVWRKKMKTKKDLHKLVLNKETVSHLQILTTEEMRRVGGKDNYEACWENMWTVYHCKYIWTGTATEEVVEYNAEDFKLL